VIVEQSSLGTHESLQAEVPFPVAIELEVENLPPRGADS